MCIMSLYMMLIVGFLQSFSICLLAYTIRSFPPYITPPQIQFKTLEGPLLCLLASLPFFPSACLFFVFFFLTLKTTHSARLPSLVV